MVEVAACPLPSSGDIMALSSWIFNSNSASVLYEKNISFKVTIFESVQVVRYLFEKVTRIAVCRRHMLWTRVTDEPALHFSVIIILAPHHPEKLFS